MRRKVLSRRTECKTPASLFDGEDLVSFPNPINCAVEGAAVNHDFDQVSFAYAPDWASGERLR
jgi:hypothetical protein